MQQGAPEESLHDLQMAAELGPDNSDVFHHRGQVLSIYSLKKKKRFKFYFEFEHNNFKVC